MEENKDNEIVPTDLTTETVENTSITDVANESETPTQDEATVIVEITDTDSKKLSKKSIKKLVKLSDKITSKAKKMAKKAKKKKSKK